MLLCRGGGEGARPSAVSGMLLFVLVWQVELVFVRELE